MTKFLCWMPDYHGDEADACFEADEIETVMADYPEYVAKQACEHWYSHGVWSGDPVPDEIDVCLRNAETGDGFVVRVYSEWEVVFSGAMPVKRLDDKAT